MHEKDRFARRLCLAVDARKYSALVPVNHEVVQNAVDGVLERAAHSAGVERDSWVRQERGDGELSLIPPTVSEPRVVDDFVRELDDELRKYNRGRTDEGRLRLRLALHHGVVFEASKGFAGAAPIHVSRILDSEQLHDALERNQGSDLAVALSDTEYEDVVAGGYCSLEPGDFEGCDIVNAAKGFRSRAWLRVLRPQARSAVRDEAAYDEGASAQTAHPMPEYSRASGAETQPAERKLAATPSAQVRQTFVRSQVGLAGINLGTSEVHFDGE